MRIKRILESHKQERQQAWEAHRKLMDRLDRATDRIPELLTKLHMYEMSNR